MRIILLLVYLVGLLLLASGDRAVLPDVLSNHNHLGCYSTTTLSKQPLFKDLEICGHNCTESLTESEDVAIRIHSCGASETNLVGVQYFQDKRSSLFFCFCGNEAKLRLLEKANGCQCCPNSADRFCGGEQAISLYNISDSSLTTTQSISEAIKTSVPHHSEKHNWYSTEYFDNEDSTNNNIRTDVESTTENLPTDVQNSTESATEATTSSTPTINMPGKESVINLDDQEATLDPNADSVISDFGYSDSYGPDISGENYDSYENEGENYGDETVAEKSTETVSQLQSARGDETVLETSTETVSQLQSSPGKLWELWVIVVVSALCILIVGAVIILVSFVRARLQERQMYV